ncbi:hypothetical protein ACH5Y9_22175 [Methylomonas sp. BW4-1]|uniref:hypothetical protein n=1 Tax=Methylomonas sp. BW4-1 TaxID=3376685 RepID=UPI004042DCB0
MYGQIFQQTVGKPVTDFKNILDIEKAAETSLKHPLKVQSIESPLVTRHGNIFPYMPGLFLQISEKIDNLLSHHTK